MRRVLLFFLFIASMTSAHAAVIVSPYIVVTHAGNIIVPGRTLRTIPLANAQPGDEFAVGLVINNAVYKDISAYIMDKTNLNLLTQGSRIESQGVTRHREIANTPITFVAKANSYGEYILVLDNRYANFIAKKISWQVTMKINLPNAVVQSMTANLEKAYAGLKHEFVFSDFDIHVQSCGTVNAFSNPNVTICTELLDQLVEQHESEAFSFIIAHEIGHSLMNLWGLPDYNNEDMADQFAAALLLRSPNGVESLDKAMEWFSQQNSSAQANYMLQHGDPHSHSVQRVRNIQDYVANPGPMEARWNHVFYPHMTKTALMNVIAHPERYDDVALAKQALAALDTGKLMH